MYCYENIIVVVLYCCCYQILFVNYYNNYFEIKLINLFVLGLDNIKHGIIILICTMLVCMHHHHQIKSNILIFAKSVEFKISISLPYSSTIFKG